MNKVGQLRKLVAGEEPIAFCADAGATELLALLQAKGKFASPSAELELAFEERQRQVCKAVRNGRLVLDYSPPADGTVSLPETDHALYAQALIYWAATLREPIMRMAEACRRAGHSASPSTVKKAARQIEFEDSTVRTDRLYLPGFKSRS